MTSLPKLVATDLDGTIVRPDLTVSPYTTQVFSRLAEQGVILVGVTGRGPRLRGLTSTDMPSARYLVMGGGCFVFEALSADNLISHHATLMAGEDAAKAVGLIEAACGPLRVVVEKHADRDTPLLGDVIEDWPFPVPILPKERATVLDGDIVKAFIRSEEYHPRQLLRMAREIVPPELAAITDAGVGNVEICPAGIYKDTGLAQVATRCGIDPSEVLTFGDATNDLPMFAWAGHAVAMGQSSKEIQLAANDVTNNVEADGVAQYLAELFTLDSQ